MALHASWSARSYNGRHPPWADYLGQITARFRGRNLNKNKMAGLSRVKQKCPPKKGGLARNCLKSDARRRMSPSRGCYQYWLRQPPQLFAQHYQERATRIPQNTAEANLYYNNSNTKSINMPTAMKRFQITKGEQGRRRLAELPVKH